MDEKIDLKSKYERLRKKFAQLKQQTVVLKESLETKENEFKHLKSGFEELEIKHKECVSSLDASQYRETQLKREIEEILCQLEQSKSHGNIKNDQTANQNGKMVQGILTGLLPMNGVIMNFQKNEKLEEKVAVLQEELDLKILENEKLHIKEFDLKRQHEKAIEEHLVNNAKLNNEIENLHSEINELKLKRKNEDDILDELNRLKEKDRINNKKIAELLENINLNGNNLSNKLNKIRKLVPPVNLLQLEEDYLSWVNTCRQKGCFVFLKLESLIYEFLKRVVLFVENWSECVGYYINKFSFQDNIIEGVYKKILILLKEVDRSLIDSSGVVFQNEFILEQNFTQSTLNYSMNDQNKLNNAEIKNVLVEKSKNAMDSIQNALNLQIVAFKMEFNKLSAEFQSENKKALSGLFTVIKNIKKYLSEVNCLFNFSLNLGKEPDLLYTHTLWTNSFHVAFLELRRDMKDHLTKFCAEIEEKKQFFDFVKRILVEDINFQDENISLSKSFISSHKKLIELEAMRKSLYIKMNLKIKSNIELISAELKDANKIFESFFFSKNSTLPFFNEASSDIKNDFCSSVLELSRFLDEKKDYFEKLVSSLYQHPSIICQSVNNFNELQITMRETKSKLETAPPKITLPELHILNKRIEQLEETKNEQLKTINSLMSQLNSVNQSSNLDNHKSDLNDDLPSMEAIPDCSSSEPCKLLELRKTKSGNQTQKYIHEVFESQLREANETLENTVTRLQLRINDLNDDIEVTRQSYDEQISLLSQHICSLSEKLAFTDASTLSSFNQEILCYSCESWSTLDSILNKTKGACQKCKTKLLRPK
ncbi:uncharacterized protein cubi_02898 [Cryptosporidium ubiquitum]|uniref:Protein phosphatase 1 regulatory subunit 21 C-terminal domain-containing protein n=1 Tax=Cryptosporidium ubiquitum TaxID=857276 RepID=A0A1J4MIQ3_9CRYT|nr:uncharacterized protein cubi_02898 [Cryptosporidium ubiquitum]OII74096.1 hypothetical protein cubi_02898 [Cryptosporidium ubiquitum]